MGSDLNVRQASADDVAGMAATLALAFDDDPVMRWLFGAVSPRPGRYVEPYLAHEGHRHLRHAEVYTADGYPGAAYWDPPGHWKTPVLSTLQLTPLILRGVRTRAVNALRGLGRMEKAHAQHPEHYYLAVLGTRPERQGQGVGAYQESSKESNVPYYRRHGFEVVGEVTFPGGPTIWPMWRDPRPPA